MDKNVTRKLIESHLVEGGMRSGAEIGLKIDQTLTQDVLTVVSISAAEVARPVRYLNMVLGAALMVAPFMFAAGMAATIVSVVLGVALIALSLRRGLIRERYGNWGRWII